MSERREDIMMHTLKCDPQPWVALMRGDKTFEFRKDDRDGGYQLGDVLAIELCLDGARVGRFIFRAITYVLRGPLYGVPEGYAVLGLSKELDARGPSDGS
jgi:hypothetical protein